MASINARKGEQGTAYRVMWREPSGRQRSMTLKTRKEAERFKRSIEADLDRGRYEDPHSGNISLEEWSERVLNGLQVKPSTMRSYKSLLSNHILPQLGDRSLRSLKRVDLQEWIGGLELSAARTRQAHRVLARVLSEAVQSDLLTKNPAKGLTLPRVPPKEVVPLAPAQLRELSAACGHYETFVLWLGVMGTRFSETTALTYEQFGNGEVVIDRSDDGSGTGTPKSHAVRRLPVPQFLRSQVGEGSGRVFTTVRGQPIHNSNFNRRIFRPACQQRDLSLTPHDLRHTCASLLIDQGASIKLLQRWLGHASAQMTLDVYAHLFPNDLKSIGVKLEKLFS